MLERALGDQKAVEIMGRLSTYIRVTPFEFLRKIDPIQVFNFLQHEHAADDRAGDGVPAGRRAPRR